MAYAFVGAKSNTSNGNSITYSPTAGNLLAVFSFTSTGGGSPTASVTDNLSTVWSTARATANLPGSPNGWTSAFYLPNCPSGITSVTVTFNGGTPGQTDIMIVEYSGVGNALPFIVIATQQQSSPGTGTDLVSSGNGNVTSQPALVIGISNNGQGNGGFSAGTGFTARTSTGSAWMKVEDKRVTATGNVAATFTSTRGGTDDFVTMMMAFAEPFVRPIQETQSTGSSGTSVNLAFTSNEQKGSSNQVVVRALTSTSFSVTDSQGNTYSQRGSTLNDGGGGHSLAQFTCDNVSAGANTVTVTCSPSGTSISIWIREIGDTIGFDTHAEQIQAGINNNTANAVTTGLANPGFSPGLVSGFTNITIANPPVLSAGSGYTSDGSPWGAGSSISQHQRYVAANAIASTSTISTTTSTNAFSFAALFKEFGAIAGKSLTGQTITSSQGPAGRSVSYVPSAQSITSSEGSINESLTLVLGSQTATFGEGNLLNSINLTGQTATFSAGTLTKFVSGNVTTSLSGISASFSEGSLALSLGYILDSNLIVMVGQTATFAQGQITATVSPAITAQTITSTEGSISAGTSSGPTYTLGSISAVFAQGNISASVAGNVSTQLLGQTATFTEGVLVDALSYSVTGLTLTSTEGLITFSVSGDVAFQVNGQTATFSEGLMALAFPGGMPNLIGLNYYEALLVMQQAGVYAPQKIGYFGTFPITARWIPSPQTPETVLAQSVSPGTTFKVNMPITLTLSEFPVSVALP